METLKREVSKMDKQERLLILEKIKTNTLHLSNGGLATLPKTKIKDHKITKKTTILSFD